MSEIYSYIGAGQIYLENLANSKGLLPIGEVSKLELSIDTDKKELPSHTQTGGGLADSVSRIKGMKLAMDVNSLSPENIARALYGSVNATAAAAVTDEPHTANVGALIALASPPDLGSALTVTGTGGTPEYTEGADYERTPAGIRVIDGGAIANGADLLIDYQALGHDVVEMLTNSGEPYRLYFEGLNEARSDKPVLVELYRCKFEPTSGFGFIADDFGSLSLNGDVLKDAGKNGAGVSKFASIKMV